MLSIVHKLSVIIIKVLRMACGFRDLDHLFAVNKFDVLIVMSLLDLITTRIRKVIAFSAVPIATLCSHGSLLPINAKKTYHAYKHVHALASKFK